MRVPQEKHEPCAVNFVSANKHANVLSQICRTTYTILHKISQIRIFLIFANFRKCVKFLERSISSGLIWVQTICNGYLTADYTSRYRVKDLKHLA